MPIYEYQCPKCHSIFEEWVKVSEAHGEEPCPECGTSSPRLISHTSFVLKGGGWYVTDYGYRKGVKDEDSGTSSSGGGSSSSDSSSSSGSAASSESKSESSSSATKASGESKSSAKSSGKGKSASKGKASKK